MLYTSKMLYVLQVNDIIQVRSTCSVSVARSLVFCVVFCRLFFVLLSFFFWPLYYLSSFYDFCLPISEFLKFVGPIGPRGQKIMRSANNVGNAGPHVRQTFLNDVFNFLTEVGNAGRIVNTGTSSVNSEFVTALNT